MRIQQLTIPGTFPGFNEVVQMFAKRGITGYLMLKTKYTGIARVRAEQQLKPVNIPPVDLRFDWFTDESHDHDNIMFARKCVIDGLVNASILPTDDKRGVGNFRGDVFHEDKRNPRIIVTILERSNWRDERDFAEFGRPFDPAKAALSRKPVTTQHGPQDATQQQESEEAATVGTVVHQPVGEASPDPALSTQDELCPSVQRD